MSENILTTTTPDGTTTVRPIPPSWASVAPLLARWDMALIPQARGVWDVFSGYTPGADHLPMQAVRGVAFEGVPQAIQEVAARCAAAAGEEATP